MPQTVSATRVVWRSSYGPDAPSSYLGGLYTLRGYGWRTLSGLRTLAIQQEVRAPLVRRMVLGVPAAWELPPVGGAAFVDAGWAWNPYGMERLGITGFGVYIGGGVFPSIRWNWAWRTTDFRRFQSRPVRQFLIAYDF